MEFAQKITRGGQVFTNLHHQTLWLCSIGSTKCFCKCTQHHLGWAAFMKRTNIKQAMNQTNNPRFAHCLWFHHCWVGELWTFQSLQEVHSPLPNVDHVKQVVGTVERLLSLGSMAAGWQIPEGLADLSLLTNFALGWRHVWHSRCGLRNSNGAWEFGPFCWTCWVNVWC